MSLYCPCHIFISYFYIKIINIIYISTSLSSKCRGHRYNIFTLMESTLEYEMGCISSPWGLAVGSLPNTSEQHRIQSRHAAVSPLLSL